MQCRAECTKIQRLISHCAPQRGALASGGCLPVPGPHIFTPPPTMSFDDPDSQHQLSTSLEKLKMAQDDEHSAAPNGAHAHPHEEHSESETHPDGPSSSQHPPLQLATPRLRDGLGFRPASGISTPQYSSRAVAVGKASSPLPDSNGLGWPGQDFPPLARLPR